VAEFHDAFGQPLRREPTGDIPREEHDLRIELIREELEEFIQAATGNPDLEVVIQDNATEPGAIYEPNLIEIADALGDLSYVVYGAALFYGIDLNEVVTEIHRSNMSKLDPETGEPLYREDGKVMKGDDYWPPDISNVLDRQPPLHFDFEEDDE
jgi:predicted HAD superfamily Cof-like phosphohydrolase